MGHFISRLLGMKSDEKDEWSLDHQLKNAIDLRNNHNQTFWTVFAIFWPTNAILLMGLFNKGDLPNSIIGIIVSFVGIAMSTIWYLAQLRTIAHLKYYDKIIEKIEMELKIDPKYATSPRINLEDYYEFLYSGIKAPDLMRRAIALTAIVWLCFLIIFLIR